MKTLTLIVGAAMMWSVSTENLKHEDHDHLHIGDKAPLTDYKMKDISGEMMSLNDLKKEEGLLVIFSCNTCPFVVGYERVDDDGNITDQGEGWQGRYNGLYDLASQNNVGMVLVNSNEAKRDGDDSFDAMKEHAKNEGYKSYYVVDKDSKLANAFGAKTTPHVYLFDKDMKLVYTGAIDDNIKSSKEVEEHYLNDAINHMLKGEKIDPETTKEKGCSIKRLK